MRLRPLARQVKACYLQLCHGGIVRIRRAIISPLVTLSIAGTIAAGIAVPFATAAASTTPVAAASQPAPATLMHW
jgi:hypothetical protein